MKALILATATLMLAILALPSQVQAQNSGALPATPTEEPIISVCDGLSGKIYPIASPPAPPASQVQSTINKTPKVKPKKGNTKALLVSTVSVSLGTASVTEAGATNLVYTFTRDNPTDPLTVNFNVTGTATFNTDYTATGAASFTSTNGTVAFPANVSSVSVTVNPSDDIVVELDESVAILLTTSPDYNIGNPNIAVGTIQNDEQCVISLIGNWEATEKNSGNANTFPFTYNMTNPVDVNITFTAQGSDGTATFADNDYRNNTFSLVTPAGNYQGQLVNLPAFRGDTKVEADETFTTTMGQQNFFGRNVIFVGGASNLSRTTTIINDDAAQLSIAPVTSVLESAGPQAVNLSLSATVDVPITVNFSTQANGTANASDFMSITNQSVTIPANTTSVPVNVGLTNDNLVEATETYGVSISNLNPNGRSVTLDVTQQSAEILNDDASIVNIASNVSVLENSGTPLGFSVSLTNPVDGPVTVTFNTANGTAIAGADYTSVVNQTVSFPANSTAPQAVNVTYSNDGTVELDETFTANLSNVNASGLNVSIGTGTRTGTLQNDDQCVITPIGTTDITEGNSGNTNYTYVWNFSNPVDVAIEMRTTPLDGTATAADNDYLTSGVNWNLPVGFVGNLGNTLPLVTGDVKVEANETMVIKMEPLNFQGRNVVFVGGVNMLQRTLNILNDDSATLSITSDDSKAENNGPNVFQLALSNPVDVPVSVVFNTNDGTATIADFDYVGITNQTVTFPANSTTQNVSVAISNDFKVEPDENYTVNISNLNNNSRNVTLGTSTRTGNILTDDLDGDNDNVADVVDNCPTTPNTNQADSDGDNIGDACDPCTNPTITLPANGASTVSCLTSATQPVPPNGIDQLGQSVPPSSGPVIINSPNPITCEGTRTYRWFYTDCNGVSTYQWEFVYTIDLQPFTVPANGAATVACPAAASQPVPPTVTSDCGTILTPTGPVITNNPNPLTCEGTTTYAWTYTDCAGNSATWSFVYTIERNPFSIPANGAATVACPALATPPTPPTVTSNCGEAITPTGPVITNAPNPLTCEGTHTYAWTYTDCEGNAATWSFVYTIEREPFTIGTPNGAATVACPALATQPTPPTVNSNCGEPINPTGPVITNVPNPLTCEGTRTYAWTYTDCEGNSAVWSFVYTIEREPFTLPVNGAATVACPALATQPTPPTVNSNCGEPITPIGPVITNVPNPLTCEGTRTYAWTFTDCEGNTAVWSFIYTIEREPFTLPANGAATVACPSLATQPTPPTVNSNCGEPITPVGPVITNVPNPLTCEGTRTYAWTYTDCEGNTAVWSFVYTIEREPFTIGTPNGAATVACPANATQPTPPTVNSNCGEAITPVGPVITNAPNPLTCEGTRTYAWTYTDCEGNTAVWSFVYTIEREPFTIGTPNGAATVACPANATQPTPPTVNSNCGEPITPVGPVITNAPNPLTCEGTRTYAWTYTDCEGNSAVWSFTYTIERNPFTVPANGAATVACPANATQPTPPTVNSNCGDAITPVGPVITNAPNPLTCEGTRTYVWTYTDCEGNTATWSFVYTIERQPFTVPANGSATVACPAQADVQPTPPLVTSNCGEVLTPVITSTPALGCEGNRNWYFTYTDCEGNTATWLFFYTVEYLDFAVPASVVENLACPINATLPTPPTVADNCGKLLTPIGPVITSTDNSNGCESSRKYEWTYKDCEGNLHTWSTTYNFIYEGDFFAPADEENFVTCLAYAVPPFPQVLYDNCGQQLNISGPTVEEDINSSGCKGWRKYSYVFTDCAGNSKPWSFTYFFDDNEGPLGTCPSGNSAVSINVSNLACIEDVPCPDDYDFEAKVEELIEAGNYYDVCSGYNINVVLEGNSDLWDCSDADGDGIFTFGRTFYFRISDACGNEAASLCEVTYSGTCLPLESFGQSDWGISGAAPGNDAGQTDLQVISALVSNLNPLVVGGGNRSLTVNDPQCIVSLLPGTGGPSRLANCHQVNCSGGCNPMGIGGMKNALAANAIALTLNMRYNSSYNNLSLNAIRNQSLACIGISPDILNCNDSNGNCKLRAFDQQGELYEYPYTLGGLLDFANYYLGGNLAQSTGNSILVARALNESILAVNAYWSKDRLIGLCSDAIAAPDLGGSLRSDSPQRVEQQLFTIAPNPASNEVYLRIPTLVEGQEVIFELYNPLGQLVLRKDFGMISYVNEQIDLSGVKSGIYVANIIVGNEQHEQKLVIGKE